MSTVAQSNLRDYLAGGQISVADALFARYADTDLTHPEFVVYLFLLRWLERPDTAVDLDTLAQQVKLSASAVFTVIQSLIQKKAVILTTERDATGRAVDRYDVTPLLERVLSAQPSTSTAPTTATAAVYTEIETEFGRPLSPIEQQTIRAWLETDHYAPDLIQLALREAVLNQAYSLRYMDRILLNWEKKHLTTPAQVQAAEQRNLGL